jgi:MauM/NapG family ferredoxin protein
VDVRFALPAGARRTPVDVGRRRLLGAAACGLAAAALPRASLAARPGLPHRFMRPPGAVRERDFLECCARCGQCVQSCPTGFVQPALLEAGVEGLWTPVLDARAGWCAPECQRCTGACPTGALAPLTLEQKRAFKIGTAVVDRSRCYTWADGFECTVCADRCPVTPKAIRFREVESWDFHGRLVKVRQVYVVPGLCTGCGICEHFCPRGGAPGIVNTAEDEDREAVG